MGNHGHMFEKRIEGHFGEAVFGRGVSICLWMWNGGMAWNSPKELLVNFKLMPGLAPKTLQDGFADLGLEQF